MPTLSGSGLTLRPPRDDDVQGRLALGNPPEVMRMFGADPGAIPPLTLEAARKWVERLATHPHAWVIEHEGRFLGEIRLDDLDNHDRRARLAVGFYDARKLGRGLGRKAVHLLLTHAFGSLALHRVSLRVIAYNERAIRCYLSCGFKEEGRERDAAFVAGQWHDDVIMGVLAQELRTLG
ncbi:MAG: GNAT family N-acetyltransferase [Rhodospirillales bacterium]|nr:GNAT family N-acetyltransferase [Rhodospirillales bacterium]